MIVDYFNLSYCIIAFLIGCLKRSLPMNIRWAILVPSLIGIVYVVENILVTK